MKLKTTKELMDELKDESAFSLAWSILWRIWTLMLVVYAVLGVLTVILES